MKHKMIVINQVNNLSEGFQVQAVYNAENKMIAVVNHLKDHKEDATKKPTLKHDVIELDAPDGMPVDLRIEDDLSLVAKNIIEQFNQTYPSLYDLELSAKQAEPKKTRRREEREDIKKIIVLSVNTFIAVRTELEDYVECEVGVKFDSCELALSQVLNADNTNACIELLNKTTFANGVRLYLNVDSLGIEKKAELLQSISQNQGITYCVLQGASANEQKTVDDACAVNRKPGTDYFSLLHPEMKANIASHLKPSDINAFVKVSRSARASLNESFWHEKLKRDFVGFKNTSPHAVINWQDKYEYIHTVLSRTFDEEAKKRNEDAELFAEVRAGDIRSLTRRKLSVADLTSKYNVGYTRQKNLVEEAQLAAHQVVLNHFYSIAVKHLSDTNALEDAFGNRLLHWAIKTKQSPQIVKSLMRDCYRDNLKNKFGQTPLSLAIDLNSEELVKLLVASKDTKVNEASHQVKDHLFLTPLGYAIKYHKEEALKILLEEKRIDINLSNPFALPPLLIAAMNNNRKAVTELLKRGAKINDNNAFQVLPQEYTRDRRIENQIRLMEYLQAVKNISIFNLVTLKVLDNEYRVPASSYKFLETLCQVVFGKDENPDILEEYATELETDTFRSIYRDHRYEHSRYFYRFNRKDFIEQLKSKAWGSVHIIIGSLDETGIADLITVLKGEDFPKGLSFTIKRYSEISELDQKRLADAVKENTRVKDFRMADKRSSLQEELDLHCAKNRNTHNYLKDNKAHVFKQIKTALLNLETRENQKRLEKGMERVAIKVINLRYAEDGPGDPQVAVFYSVTDLGRENSFHLMAKDCLDESAFLLELNKKIESIEKAIDMTSEHTGYLKQNKKQILEIILKCLTSAGIDVRSHDYGIETGKLCITVSYQIGERIGNLSYIEEDCIDVESFLNDLLTDIAIVAMNAKYQILSKVKEVGSIPYDHSYNLNVFMGWPGLSDFFNVKEMKFDWDKFNLFLERVNAPYNQKKLLANVTGGRLFAPPQSEVDPDLKTGIEVIPFPKLVALAEAYRKLAASEQKVVASARLT